MFVGFIVVSSGVIGYCLSSQSIEQSKATERVKTETAAMETAYQKNLTMSEKRYHECVSTYSVLLADAQKYGHPDAVSKRKSDLRDCNVFLK